MLPIILESSAQEERYLAPSEIKAKRSSTQKLKLRETSSHFDSDFQSLAKLFLKNLGDELSNPLTWVTFLASGGAYRSIKNFRLLQMNKAAPQNLLSGLICLNRGKIALFRANTFAFLGELAVFTSFNALQNNFSERTIPFKDQIKHNASFLVLLHLHTGLARFLIPSKSFLQNTVFASTLPFSLALHDQLSTHLNWTQRKTSTQLGIDALSHSLFFLVSSAFLNKVLPSSSIPQTNSTPFHLDYKRNLQFAYAGSRTNNLKTPVPMHVVHMSALNNKGKASGRKTSVSVKPNELAKALSQWIHLGPRYARAKVIEELGINASGFYKKLREAQPGTELYEYRLENDAIHQTKVKVEDLIAEQVSLGHYTDKMIAKLIRAEGGNAWGAKAKVANKLGVDSSDLHKLIREAKAPSPLLEFQVSPSRSRPKKYHDIQIAKLLDENMHLPRRSRHAKVIAEIGIDKSHFYHKLREANPESPLYPHSPHFPQRISREEFYLAKHHPEKVIRPSKKLGNYSDASLAGLIHYFGGHAWGAKTATIDALRADRSNFHRRIRIATEDSPLAEFKARPDGSKVQKYSDQAIADSFARFAHLERGMHIAIIDDLGIDHSYFYRRLREANPDSPLFGIRDSQNHESN